jgi:hypothetical protein
MGKSDPVAPVILLVSNLSRIQGLAKGVADAVQLCKAEANWEGVIRTLLEIERLAGELLPERAVSDPNPLPPSPGDPTP